MIVFRSKSFAEKNEKRNNKQKNKKNQKNNNPNKSSNSNSNNSSLGKKLKETEERLNRVENNYLQNRAFEKEREGFLKTINSKEETIKKTQESLGKVSKENESLRKALEESKGFKHYWKNSSTMKKAGLIGIGTLGAYGAYSAGKKILGNRERTNKYGDTYYS